MARFGDFDQYLDNAGDPLSEGKLYFYESGTTTPKITYADINNSIPNTNPVLLTASGRQPNIFFEGVAKVILADNNDVQIAVRDPVGETGTNFGDQWVATKTYSALDVVLGSDGVYYRSLINGNQNNNPVTTTGLWTLLYSVDWNAGITYQEGAVISYNGEQYQSITNGNLNNNPSTSPNSWTLLSFAWTSTAEYSENQNAVGSDGILYTSQQDANAGNDPTDPANRPTYWVGTSADSAASAAASAASAIESAASAVESASSATDAQTAENNAETAQAAAEAAQALAEAAVVDANTAVSEAEAAALESEAARDSAQIYAAAAQSAAGIPTLSGNAGKALSVNALETGVEWAEVESDSTLGTLTHSFIVDEQKTITLSSEVLNGVPVVSVTKEVPQTGITNNQWDVDTTNENYDLNPDEYPNTGINFDQKSYDPNDSTSITGEPTDLNYLTDVWMHPDGTYFYVCARSSSLYGYRVNSYSLSTPFDLNTKTLVGAFDRSDTVTNSMEIGGFFVVPDGSAFFIYSSSTEFLYKHNMSTPHDPSTAGQTPDQSFDLNIGDIDPQGISFSYDGTKAFSLGLRDNQIDVYTLGTAWDLTTMSYSTQYLAMSNWEYCWFSNDGLLLWIGTGTDDFLAYELSTAYDLSTRSGSPFIVSDGQTWAGSSLFDLAFVDNNTNYMYFIYPEANATNIVGKKIGRIPALDSGSFTDGDLGKKIFFNNGEYYLTSTDFGLKTIVERDSDDPVASGDWYLRGIEYDAVDGDIKVTGIEETLSYMPSTPEATYDPAEIGTFYSGVSLTSDGLTAYLNSSTVIYQYSLSTAFDISSATYTGNNYTITGITGSSRGMFFKPDGTKMFLTSSTELAEYDLAVAYNVASASFVRILTTAYTSLTSISISNDGEWLHAFDTVNDTLYEYSLQAVGGWSLSLVGSTPYTLVLSTAYAHAFSPDGLKLYMTDGNLVRSFSGTTPFRISTFTLDSESATVDFTNGYNLTVSSDERKLYILDGTSVNQFDINGATGVGDVQVAITNRAIDSTYWTEINSMTATQESNSVYYSVSTDGKTTWQIADNSNGIRNIARDNSGTWEYNSNVTYGSETWTSASANNIYSALKEALAIEQNQMTKTQMEAVAEGNLFTTGNTFDLAIGLSQGEGHLTVSSGGVSINYDANTLNEGALIGTDFDFDFPASNKLRITAINAGNYKVRVL